MRYCEASDQDLIDKLRKLLPPPVAEIGQLVWWTNGTGTIYQGRINRMEIGYYGFKPEEYPTRRYVARSERCHYTSFNEVKVNQACTHDWESDTYSGNDSGWWSKFQWTFDDALERAAKELDAWAESADRDAARRRADAERYRSMKTALVEKAEA